MSTKSELKNLGKLILFYQGLVNNFPNSNAYKDALLSLKGRLDNTVPKIRKKKNK